MVSEGTWSPRPIASLVTTVLAHGLPVLSLLAAGIFVIATGRWVAGWFLAIALLAVCWTTRLWLLSWATTLRIEMQFPNSAPPRPLVAARVAFSRRVRERLLAPPGENVAEAAHRLVTAALIADRTRWGGQAVRVGGLSHVVASHLHWGETDRSGVWWAALSCDLGTLGRGEQPDEPETASHALASVELLRPLALWLRGWIRAVAEHHELWSGAGSPAGLATESIHPGARLLAIAAEYDQLTSGSKMSPAQAKADLLRTATWQFDPNMVEIFNSLPLDLLRRSTGGLWAGWRTLGRWLAVPVLLLVVGTAAFASLSKDRPTEVAGISLTRTATTTTDGATTTAVAAGVTPTTNAISGGPLLADDRATTFEDIAVLIAVAANDAIADPDAATLRVAVAPRHGSAVVTATKISYTPAPDFKGNDSFQYELCSVDGPCGRATVRITISSVDDPPGAGTIGLMVLEDQVQFFAPTATDPEGEKPICSITLAPTHGAASVAADCSSASYRPFLDYNGADRFEYSVAASGAATIGTVEIIVAAVNDLPIVRDIVLGLDEDTTRTFVPTITDPDNGAHQCRIVRFPQYGTAVITAGCSTASYTPSSNFAGGDAFLILIDDGSGTVQAEVNVIVTAIDDPPVAAPMLLSTKAAQAVSWIPAVSDPDSTALSCSIPVAPKHGVATVTPACTVGTYVPTNGYSGADAFTYRVSDGHSSAVATVSVTVGKGEAPVALPVTVATPAGTSVPWLPQVSDEDTTTLTCSISVAPTNGVATVMGDCSAGTYAPVAQFVGVDTFTYRVSDGTSAATALVTVTVAAVNQPPVARGGTLVAVEDGGPASFLPVITDVDDVTFACTISAPGQHGAVVVASDCSGGSYTPVANYFGSDTFAFQACDGGGLCDTGSFSVTVTPANDAPTAGNVSIVATPGAKVTWFPGVADIDDDELTCRIVTPPQSGSVKVDSDCSEGEVSAGVAGVYTFTYEVSDGSLTDTAVGSLTVA